MGKAGIAMIFARALLGQELILVGAIVLALGYDLYLGVALGALCTAFHLGIGALLRLLRGMGAPMPVARQTQERAAVGKAGEPS